MRLAKIILAVVGVLALLAASLFYLLVVPALVATGEIEPAWYSIAFGAFLYAQLWMLIAQMIADSASQIYGFPRWVIVPWIRIPKIERPISSRFATVPLVVVSFLLTVYGFAIAYVYLSNSSPDNFSVGALTLFQAFYLSFLTAVTVSFGDIIPTSWPTQVLAMAEVFFFFVYAAFLIGVLPGLFQRHEEDSA